MAAAVKPRTAMGPSTETRATDAHGPRPSNTPARRHARLINVDQQERWLSGLSGGALAVYGLRRGGWSGWLMAFAGGSLIYRGVTGHCDVYGALGINTVAQDGGERPPKASVRHGEGIKIEKSVTINQPAEQLFRFWRNFENLPQIMQHLEAVQIIDERRSRWQAKAPAGTTVEWEAEIITEEPNRLIGWRSVGDSAVANAGSVRFEPLPNGRGTVVKVALSYEPPGGLVGSWLAKLFGEEPEQQVEDDLRNFKQMMEAGEIATVAGQPSGQAHERTTAGGQR
jgi:uncharacterized membrane protein